MDSAIYEGSVTHVRVRPVRHRLRYPMLDLLIDLDEAPALDRRLRLFGHNRRAVFGFHDRDHLDGSGRPLVAQVRDMLRDAGIDPAGGRVLALAMPRVLGFVFNPISIYFCLGPDGAMQAMLYEVNNTFGQRHSYLIPAAGAGALHQDCDKRFYVSPFMDMAQRYRFRVAPPGEKLAVAIEATDASGGQVEQRRGAQPTRADDQHPCVLQALLPVDAEVRDDQVAAVARHLFARQ